jgi:DNA-directed RNA polymerase specialized sigma24 family protein
MTSWPPEPEPRPDREATRDADFSEFYRSSFSPLVGRCIRIGVPAAEAPGIVQELMLEIYRRWADIGSPERYAGKTVAMRAAGFLKISVSTLPKETADLARLGQPLTSAMPDGILAVDEEQVVLQAMRQLSPVQRAVFALDYDEFTTSDIAAILNMEEATVRSNLRHARTALRSWWERTSRLSEGGDQQ